MLYDLMLSGLLRVIVKFKLRSALSLLLKQFKYNIFIALLHLYSSENRKANHEQ